MRPSHEFILAQGSELLKVRHGCEGDSHQLDRRIRSAVIEARRKAKDILGPSVFLPPEDICDPGDRLHFIQTIRALNNVTLLETSEGSGGLCLPFFSPGVGIGDVRHGAMNYISRGVCLLDDMPYTLRSLDSRYYSPDILPDGEVIDRLRRATWRSRHLATFIGKGSITNTVSTWLTDYGSVLEFLPGTDLSRISTRDLSNADIARIGQAVAIGIGDLLDEGLIHRDIKPANVIRGKGLHIIDFDLVRTISQLRTEAVRGVRRGTPRFIPPELLSRGWAEQYTETDWETHVGPRIDSYALGVMICQMCEVRRSYTPTELELAIHSGEYRAELLTGLDAVQRGEFRELVRHLCEPNVEERKGIDYARQWFDNFLTQP